MCGRTSLANLPEHLKPFLGRYGIVDVPPWYTPRYNVAPSQDQMVIVERGDTREARRMKWGLVPRWASDPGIGSRMINARSETLAVKPAYRESFARRRGLMVVDSYYEWRKNPSGAKTPFRVYRDGGLAFTLAALWELWERDGERLETCTVITTAATEPMQRIHERMPVIVPESAADEWLSEDASPAALNAIFAAGAEGLTADAVSPYVNAPQNDSRMCWDPIGETPIQ